MNAMNDVAEARATALSLRASARACAREQGALKFRLTRAAESLDAMVRLAELNSPGAHGRGFPSVYDR